MAARSTLPGSGGTGDTTGNVWNTTAINKLPGGFAAWKSQAGGVDITALADVDSVTITAMTSRLYEVVATVSVSSDVADDVVRMTIADGSNTALKQQDMPLPKASTSTPMILRYLHHAPSAGSHTYKIRGEQVTGTGTVTCGATLLTVNDTGPDF